MESWGTMSTRVLLTKFFRLAGTMSPFSWAWFMVFWSAEANTSTGAPWAICWSKGPEAAKLKMTLVPGCCCSKRWPISGKALVKLAAAETVNSWAAIIGAAWSRAIPPRAKNPSAIILGHFITSPFFS